MEELNKFLTEAMGECWHTHPPVIGEIWGIKCDKCGIIVSPNLNNNFLTWEGFGKLWKWGNKQEWIGEFIYWYNSNMVIDEERLHIILSDLVDPEFFAKAVVVFLPEK